MSHDPDCICHGNWRKIVAKAEPFIGRRYKDTERDTIVQFFGVVHADDDYYYGIVDENGKARLLSCVGSLESHGLELIPLDNLVQFKRLK